MNCARNAERSWPVLLASLSFLHVTNFSDSIFRDVLGALDSHCPHHVTHSWTTTTTRRPCSTNHNTLRLRCASPSHLRDLLLVWRELAEVASPGLGLRDLACLRAHATLFLAWTLGSRWFAILEVLQNADHILTTCGVARHADTAIRNLDGR
jgi:hypothetical protein